MLRSFSQFKFPAKIYYLLIILLISTKSFAQLPTISFTAPTEACLEEQFELSNESENAERYFWDFCEGDLQGNSLQVRALSNALFSTPLAFDVIQSEGKWYGFVANMSTHRLSRLDFGETLLNPTPVVVDLGNPDNLLSAPQDMEVVEQDGLYYGFVYNRNSNQLVRLSFGTSLAHGVKSSEVLLTGSGMGNGGIEVVFDGISWYAFLTNRYTLTVIRLGASLSSQLQAEDVYTTAAIPGVDVIGDVRLVEHEGNWYGFLVGANSKTLHRLSFSNNLFSEPQAEEISGGQLSAYSLYNLEVEKEQGEWLIFSNALQGNFLRMTLGKDLLADQVSLADLGKFSILENNVKFSLYRKESRWFGLTSSWKTSRLYLLEFPQGKCGFDQVYSIEPGSVSLKSQQPGAHTITLYAQSSNGMESSLTQSIRVTENPAPQLQILNTNCVSSPITLTTKNLTPDQAITSYTWTFPDGTQQTMPEASYQFSEPGTYTVRLDVQSENSCGNFFEKEITVYPEPVANYSISASQVCTNAEVIFTNETNYAADSVITYSWDFGDGTTSTEVSPAHEYAEAGTYTVRLSADIPGCTSVSEQTVTVEQGPNTLFAASPVCDGETVIFDNQTSGANITGYQWDLGDGTFSTLENPQHIYEEPGEYMVVLKAKNSLGCETSYSQTVNVYSLPVPDFTTDKLCAGIQNPVLFTDASVDASGNIIDWLWEFEMPDGATLTSSAKDTTIVYPEAGSFEVTLSVATTWGCRQTITKTLEVEPLPEVQIGFGGACVGGSGMLSDITDTEGVAVRSRLWTIGGESFTDSTFSYTFTEAGSYKVALHLNLMNGCSTTDSTTIEIASLPEVEFDYYGACGGQSATFAATVPAAVYSWSIDGVVQEDAGAVLAHLFTEEGVHEVRLTVQDEAGCSNMLSKEIVVGPAPVAAFTPDRLKGVAPFTVNFSNESEGAGAYYWYFGDTQQSSSTEVHPSFTFTEIGDYEVQLIAFNADNCSDTLSQRISVVDPSYDVALNGLHTIRNGDQLQLVLDLENRGTIRVSEMAIEVSINNEYFFNEKFPDTLEIGQQMNYPLSMELIESSSREFRFICVRLKPVLTLVEEELSAENNEKCLNFEQAFIMQEPYPNPGKKEVVLSFVLPDQGGDISLQLYSAYGKLIEVLELKGLKAGRFEHPLSIGHLGKGIYYVRARYGAEEQQFRIMKE